MNASLVINNSEYRIIHTGLDASRYGPCERCGKKCTATYKQQFRRLARESKNWSSAGFGHPECLKTHNWTNAPILEASHE